MILLVLLFALTLSSANPIYDRRQASDIFCQEAVNPASEAKASTKAELDSKECNDSKDSSHLVSWNQDPVLLEGKPKDGVLNGSNASAMQIAVNQDESPLLSLSNSTSNMACDDLVHRENNPTIAAETIFQRDRRIKLVHFKKLNAVVPSLIAAVRLKEFFSTVAWQAVNQWPTEQPQSALFTITHGQFQLTMSCLGSTIPWPVVESAAQRFSMLASGLCVFTFDAYWMEMGTSITIAMSLRLLTPQFPTPDQPLRPLPNLHPHHLEPRQLAPPNSPTTAQLHRRIPDPTGALAMTKFRAFIALLPTAIVMSQLEDFYTLIATKIETGDFAHYPDSRVRVLMRWNFELTVSCDKMAVPWSFVQAFAIDMAEWSAREFTGFYEATVRGEGPLTGLVFLVSMKLRGSPLKNLY